MKSFFTSHDEKITEKAFSQSLVISVLSILLCLVALCSMTYAWFTEGVSSNSNTLVSGSFGLEKPVIVKTADGETSTADAATAIEVEGENGVYTCTLPANGTYRVTLTCGNSTAKGHCVVTINSQEKSTDAIIGASTANLDGYSINDPFTFQIKTSADAVEVEFRAVWGVVATPKIEKNETYSVDDWNDSSDNSTTEPDS